MKQTTKFRNRLPALIALSLPAALLGCGSDSTNSNPRATGGRTSIATGGQSAGGSAAAQGGSPATGGSAPGSGGKATSGGTSGSQGGSTASGGALAAGGSEANGGGPTSGGAQTTGGNSAAGGPGFAGSSGVTDPEPPEIIGFGKDTTGGKGGREVVVTTAAELLAAATSLEPLIITVKGSIVHDVNGGDDDARIFVTSNKTIQGADSKASVDANFNLVEANNVIFRNLNLSNVTGKGTGDAIEVAKQSTNIWVNHVTFGQCADGALDFKREADLATVSWCKFAYTSDTHRHNYANLIGHVDGWTADRGKLRVTMHHNWYADNVIERMPRVRYGQVHVFNNYYASKRTNYVVGVGVEAQILLEASYFESQGNQTWFNWYEPNKCSAECADGKIQWTADNVFDNTVVSTWAPNADVFDPPYEYKHVKQTAAEAKVSVMQRAGVLP